MRYNIAYAARGISDLVWPSYPGPDPIRDMLRDGKTHVVITMHEVAEVLDGGRFVARSHPVPLPPDANSVIVHRLTWPQMGPFIRRAVGAMLAGVEAMPARAPLVLQDAAVPYRIACHRERLPRLAA
jgi:hypothetical protein